jgi:hypothetical protein
MAALCMIRLACLVLAAALLLVVVPASASAKPPRKPKACPTKNVGESETTRRALIIDVRTAKVVIYTRVDDRDHEMFGCYRKSRKRTRLDSWYSCGCSIADEYGADVTVKGRFVALNNADFGSPSDNTDQTGSLRVVDLADARRLFRYDTGGPVDELALKPNGSVAFAFDTIRDSSNSDFDGRLVRVDKNGTAVLAEQGVEQGSLALAPSGRHIYWRDEGQYRGAPID